MFLTAKDIQKLCPTATDADMISKPSYFTPEAWNERMKFIEGSLFDITVESIWLPDPDDDSGFIGVDSRKTPRLIQVPKHDENRWLLTQGFYHVLAGEVFNMPPDVFGTVKSKRTVITFSSITEGTDIPSGYKGQLHIGLMVNFQKPFPIAQGARFAAVRFASFSSAGDTPYQGVWGGNKLSTDGIERPF